MIPFLLILYTGFPLCEVVKIAECDILGRIDEWRGLIQTVDEERMLGMEAECCQDKRNSQEGALGDQTCYTWVIS